VDNDDEALITTPRSQGAPLVVPFTNCLLMAVTKLKRVTVTMLKLVKQGSLLSEERRLSLDVSGVSRDGTSRHDSPTPVT